MLKGPMRIVRRTVAVYVAALFVTVGCSAGPSPAPSPPSSMHQLQTDLEQFRYERMAAGASAVLVQATLNEEVWLNAAGVRELETREPAEPGDSFHVASLTKSMVATSVMKLVEQGKIALDGLMGDYLPELESVLRPPKPVNVRMLLEHTSGMPSFEDALIRAGPLKQVLTAPLTAAQRIELTGSMPWNTHEIGTFDYSSSNYVVLGLLIERVTGRSLADVLRADITEPLALSGTLLTGTGDTPEKMVHGYVMIDGEQVDATYAGVQRGSASGGMISTVQDVSKFYAALLDGRLVDLELVKAMQSPNASEYGLGLAKWWDRCTNDYYYGHLGGAPGYASISADGARQLTAFVAHAAEPLSADAPWSEYGLVEFAQRALDSTCK